MSRCGFLTAWCWCSWLTTPGSASASPSEQLLGEKSDIGSDSLLYQMFSHHRYFLFGWKKTVVMDVGGEHCHWYWRCSKRNLVRFVCNWRNDIVYILHLFMLKELCWYYFFSPCLSQEHNSELLLGNHFLLQWRSQIFLFISSKVQSFDILSYSFLFFS